MGEILTFLIEVEKTVNTTITQYYQILSNEYPDFMNRYTKVPCMQRLKGVGLFCGTDWTLLYNHKFFYSRYDHSIGVALIIWHFTHDKKQTLAGLLHDVSSPCFSHVIDFKNKDYLRQESTEQRNIDILKKDSMLQDLLQEDGISFLDICDYHKYPIADNEIPGLSADRLEYMFSTGLIMADIFTLESIHQCYQDIHVLINEKKQEELGFIDEQMATLYTKKCCEVGKLYLASKNIIALQLLAKIVDLAIALQYLYEEELYTLSEKEVLDKMKQIEDVQFQQHLQTFLHATVVNESVNKLENAFCVHLQVKKRYINPLCNGIRIYQTNIEAREVIDSFLAYSMAHYACVNWFY